MPPFTSIQTEEGRNAQELLARIDEEGRRLQAKMVELGIDLNAPSDLTSNEVSALFKQVMGEYDKRKMLTQ